MTPKMRKVLIHLIAIVLTGGVYLLLAIPIYLWFGFKVAATVWCVFMVVNIVNSLPAHKKK